MNAAATAITRRYRRLFSLNAFLTWWFAGLQSCLPAFVQRLFTVAPVKMVLEVDSDELVLFKEGTEQEELGRYPLRALAESGLQRQLSKAKNKLRVLRLPAAKVLAKTIQLPMAAEANLRQVIGFEIDRLTPFSLAKVYYDAYVLERQQEAKRIQVKFVVVPRAAVDPLLDRLADIGIVPDSVEAVGETAINLLPSEKRARKSRAAQRTQWVLGAIFFVLLLAACLLPLWQQRSLIVKLMPQVDAAQREAQAVFALREELERAVESSRFLIEKRQQNIFVIELLNELTTILPDGTWVEQLTIKDGEAQIRGQSREASMLIGLVEASDFFHNVTFRSPVIADRRTGRDRFYLSAQIGRES